MSLVKHAERELKTAGLFDENSDWDFLPAKESLLGELKKYYDLEIVDEKKED